MLQLTSETSELVKSEHVVGKQFVMKILIQD